MSGIIEVNLKFYQKYLLIAVGIGLLVFLYQAFIKKTFDITFTRQAFPPELSSSLIVKDQRGHEPYMTIKMKCFYCSEEDDYGESWERITNDADCQRGLFNNCFRNRTMNTRHETHVLALFNYCQINRCFCNDVTGWCTSTSCSNVKCCLDTGQDSVIC